MINLNRKLNTIIHLNLLCARCNGVGMTTATLTDKIEGALPSQEMRKAFFEGSWTDVKFTPNHEKRIQPASYEPGIEDVCWRVPDGFNPEPGVSVIESLRRLNPRERPQYKISKKNGIVAHQGYSYLFPLEGNWTVPQNFFIRASPKSTEGRMGNLVRLVADRVSTYDEVLHPFSGKLYALVKPLVFNNRVFPGFSFTQLRAYCKDQGTLSDKELIRLINQHNLVKHNGTPIPISELSFNKGLILTADLEGKESDGVVGFKARDNPDPVDRRKFRKLDWENYFDPLLAPPTGKFDLKRGDFVLVQSWEWVEMTDTHAGVMDDYRTSLMENRAHIAGYFDARRFRGIATLEIPVIDPMPLYHRKKMCAVKYEHVTDIPDKEYAGVHQGQKFALIPKPMKLPDSAEIAGKVANEKEIIMYVDRSILFGRDHFDGFRSADAVNYLDRILDNYQYGVRGSAESGKGLEADNSRKQPIAYTVFINPEEGKIFAYERASDKTKYAETRLHGQISIGVGGHVRMEDKRENPGNPIRASLDREVHREETQHEGKISAPNLVGYINADNARQVDSVHFGLLYVIEIKGNVRPKEAEIKSGQMVTFNEFRDLMKDPKCEVEEWSKIAFDTVKRMYEKN